MTTDYTTIAIRHYFLFLVSPFSQSFFPIPLSSSVSFHWHVANVIYIGLDWVNLEMPLNYSSERDNCFTIVEEMASELVLFLENQSFRCRAWLFYFESSGNEFKLRQCDGKRI